jgi:hypothetical protein
MGGYSVPVLTVTLERIAELRESFTLCLAVLVGVNLQGDRQPGVAEDDLRVSGRGAGVLRQCRRGVPRLWTAMGPGSAVLTDAGNDRTRLRGSIGHPVRVVKTSPLSCPSWPRALRSAACAVLRIAGASDTTGRRGRSRRLQ